jgi:lysophospholipase L1-like esterase
MAEKQKKPNFIVRMIMPALQKEIKKFMDKDIEKKQDFFRDLNKRAQKGGIVFAGDSITDGYQLHEFFNCVLPLYNRGISGAAASQMLAGIDAHILGLAPARVVLLIGTNDLGNNESVANAFESIRKICLETEERSPKTEILLLSVYPVNDGFGDSIAQSEENNRSNITINELNAKLNDMAKGCKRVEYIDIHAKLTDSSGQMKKEYTHDGLHLTVAGYEVVTKILMPYITREG